MFSYEHIATPLAILATGIMVPYMTFWILKKLQLVAECKRNVAECKQVASEAKVVLGQIKQLASVISTRADLIESYVQEAYTILNGVKNSSNDAAESKTAALSRLLDATTAAARAEAAAAAAETSAQAAASAAVLCRESQWLTHRVVKRQRRATVAYQALIDAESTSDSDGDTDLYEPVAENITTH